MEAVDDLAGRVKLLKNSGNFRGVVLFDKVKMQHLRKLAMAAEQVEYASGETIFSIGEDGDALYIIVSGECCVDMNGIAGDTMSAGTSFGELALITDDKKLLQRTATIRAVGDCALLRIQAKKVQPILDSAWGGERAVHPCVLLSLLRSKSCSRCAPTCSYITNGRIWACREKGASAPPKAVGESTHF
jgi:CRP-like cAMP-binding protein